MISFYKQTLEVLETKQPFALGIISRVKGSSPQKTGAKALFLADGRIVGTLGGGCLEAEIHRRALQALRTGEASTFEMTLDHDFGWDDGLICGGTVFGLILPKAVEAAAVWRELPRVTAPRTWGVRNDFSIGWVSGDVDSASWRYHETVSPLFHLWIAGSGHIAQAVARLALTLEFDVTVFDDRPDLANHKYFPPAVELRVGNWGELLKTPIPAQPTLGLIVTRGHQHDALVLAEWVHRPFIHLGMIGSRRKSRVIREQFLKKGTASVEQMEGLSCPVGVEIEAQSVEEIAVSIMAEYIHKRAAHRAQGSETSWVCPPAALSAEAAG